MPIAVILTAISKEYRAVRNHLTDLQAITHPKGSKYEQGKFTTEGKVWDVGIAQTGEGNQGVSVEVERTIDYFNPNVIFFVGIAGGIKDVELGDVVVPSHIYNYESGSASEEFHPRGKSHAPNYKLEELAKCEAIKSEWLERITSPSLNPKVITNKPIASGEKVIKSTDSEFFQLLKHRYDDIIAVEMEGFGFLEAARANQNVPALVIRGISDLIDNKAEVDQAGYQEIAATCASAFAFELLAKLETNFPLSLSPAQYIKLKHNLADTSKGLLSWKRTLVNNQEIDRPEYAEIISRITTKEASTTIILGVPGSGKSSLMAALGHKLLAQNYTIFAIKADQLSGAINTIQDLQNDLHLELHPVDAIHEISQKETIVVLIDQLDAISELLDRKSQRLSLLLSLIQKLSGSKNIHIVSTCREFDFRYVSQFAQLAGIDRLDLNLPAWEKIAPILEASGYQPTSMGESLQELLRNPFNLNIFLDIAQPEDIFTSSQNLLNQLWIERVQKQPEAEKCVAFLEKIADYMTDEEVLWVSKAIADTSPEICQTLEQAEILITNSENGTIGFRHQTYYDYTLARAFARGSQSLTDLVLERQDGLFVRPILLRSLEYLRGTANRQYQKQLTTLLQASQQHIKPHIRTLLIEFLGAEPNPNPDEAALLVPLLNSEKEGIKVLDAMSGSQGWFKKLYSRHEFGQWMEKPLEQTCYCCPLLTGAASFAPEEVWNLLEEYWLNDKTYDILTIRVISHITQWTPNRVFLIEQVIRRSNINWDTVADIAERIAETLPDYSTKAIHGHLDYVLIQAIEDSKILPPELPADTSQAARGLHNYRYNSKKILQNLLEKSFYGIEKFAQTNPSAFLDEVWSWFTNLINQITEEHSLSNLSYRDGYSISLDRHDGGIIQSLLTAILNLAENHRQDFLAFVKQNQQSDLLPVHRLLARGLEKIASQEPQIILNYLLDDQRRLCIGDYRKEDYHCETKQLISSVCPYLSSNDRVKIEDAIRQFNYYHPWEDCKSDTRFRLLQYNRQHRLQLLLAFPSNCLTVEGKKLMEAEIRAFPQEIAEDRYATTIEAQFIGPCMTKEEMSRAKDEHLLNLFDELSDETQKYHIQQRKRNDLSRAGGVVEQSIESGKFFKDDPDRFLHLLPQLQPQQHESYVAKGLVSLVEIDFPSSDLIHLIENLNQRGFSSENFRDNAACVLEKIAERHKGLPTQILSLLKSWLTTQTNPKLEHSRSNDDHRSYLESPILFGSGVGGSYILPNGRGNIVRAIAEGYLRQNPPDLEGWTEFIRSQLEIETHPAIWVDILLLMPPLLNGDRTQATELFNQVIHNCPEVLQYAWSLYFISRTIGWFDPQETVQGWLEILKSNSSNFSQQAYGELLLIQYLRYQDEWLLERIRDHLAQENEAVLCGLAHAASHLWVHLKCRAISAEILHVLASSSFKSIQHAVSSVFRWNCDQFKIDRGMAKVIQTVCENQSVLLESANDLIEIIEIEDMVDNNPEIVVEICQSLLGAGIELTNPTRATILIADSLTRIAIQLHRQEAFREVGLQIFEQLLALNFRETKLALEMLDRRPNRQGYYVTPRRTRRRR